MTADHPNDSADAREQAEREPLRGPDLARATLAAIRATTPADPQRPATPKPETMRARAISESAGPIPAPARASSQVSESAADTESAGVEAKAAALLIAGRVRVVRADDRRLVASVTGDSGAYLVVVDDKGSRCPCVAGSHKRTCSHARAAELIGSNRKGIA